MADRPWVPLHTPAAAALWLIAALAAGPSCAAPATRFPDPFTAVYTLSTSGIPIATIERRLHHGTDGHFVFRSETRASGITLLFRKDHVIEESIWILVGEEPRPLTYTYRHTGHDTLRFQTVTFDWQRQLIDNREDKRRWRFPTAPHLLDKLLYQLAIMRDLQGGKPKLKYRFVDGGEIKTYRFANRGPEPLDTPLGSIETVKLERIVEKNDTAKTTLWCARSWGYLPVRLDTQDKSGRLLSAVIEQWSGLATKAPSPARAGGRLPRSAS
jgi:hypothetical protein